MTYPERRKCRKCLIELKHSGRGAHNRVLCTLCWVELLSRQKTKYNRNDTLAVLADEYGVSVAAISQKIRAMNDYMKENPHESDPLSSRVVSGRTGARRLSTRKP